VIETSEPGRWLIRTETDAPALLVLAETAYPGWRVTVDGQEAQALTAYTTLKGVCVPAGEHEVTWEYVPRVYQVGGVITLLALGLVVVGVAVTRRGATDASVPTDD
jgi:uncharacterized membrane protein YfhO